GFVCPRCGSTDAWWKASRRLFECKACRYQASVTAGTVMHRSRMPLRLWFWAAYLVTTHTPGLSARQFARQLDLHYETAFQMLHELRAAMVREGRERLRGTVEVDEAYIGGARSGKGGRGAYGKVLVAGAVEGRGRGPLNGSLGRQSFTAYLSVVTLRFTPPDVLMAAMRTAHPAQVKPLGPRYAVPYWAARGGEAWLHPTSACRRRR